MNGFVKLHRTLLEWEWYHNANCYRLFTHLLLRANFKPSRYQGYEIPVGSVVTGVNALADQLKLSVSQIRTAMKHLKSTDDITVKTTPKFSIVTINSWTQFQHTEPSSDRTAEKDYSDMDVTLGAQ